MRIVVVVLFLPLLLSGCVEGCGPETVATWREPGLYKALGGREGLDQTDPERGLPLVAAVLDERWGDWSLRTIRYFPPENWTRRGVEDPPYAVELALRAEGRPEAPGKAFVEVLAHASVERDRVADRATGFLALFGVAVADEARWTSDLVESRYVVSSAVRRDGNETTTYGYWNLVQVDRVVHDEERWPWDSMYDAGRIGGHASLGWNDLVYRFRLASRSIGIHGEGHTATLHVTADDHVTLAAPARYDGVHRQFKAWIARAFEAIGLPPASLGLWEADTSVC